MIKTKVIEAVELLLLALILSGNPSDAVAYSVAGVLLILLLLAWGLGPKLPGILQFIAQIIYNLRN